MSLDSEQIALIDRAAMLSPPASRLWEVEGPAKPRFEWDQRYVKNHGQQFSPWVFAKNCAAVLGHIRDHGQSVLMAEMAAHLVSVALPHVEAIGSYRYVRNDFRYYYLWHTMRPPFYGAFMNAVTAFGLLQLYEGTKAAKFLHLADRLLMTCTDERAPVPLCSPEGDGLWLLEYVFQSESPGSGVRLNIIDDWHMARIYNGHIEVVFALMRFRAMTDADCYNDAIARSTMAMERWLPQQAFEGRYFSYSPDMPVYPDYGQARAYKLAEALGELSGNAIIADTAKTMRALYETSIAGRDKEIVAAGAAEATRLRERPSEISVSGSSNPVSP